MVQGLARIANLTSDMSAVCLTNVTGRYSGSEAFHSIDVQSWKALPVEFHSSKEVLLKNKG